MTLRRVVGRDAHERMRMLADAYAEDVSLSAYLPGKVVTVRGRGAVRDAVAALYTEAPAPSIAHVSGEREFELRFDAAGHPWPGEHHEAWPRNSDRAVVHHCIYSVAVTGDEHSGLSGATVERRVLAGGEAVYVKRIRPGRDWLSRATADEGREARLWLDGTLQQLPGGIEFPCISVERDGDAWVVTTRDITPHMLKPDAADAAAALLEAVRRLTLLHDRFRGRPPARLASLAARLHSFSAAAAAAERDGCDVLPKMMAHGWAVWPTLLPDDIRAPLARLAADPAPLLAALERTPLTLTHGDFRAENIGVDGDRLLLIDWSLACAAPAEIDLVWLLGTAPTALAESLEPAVTRLPGVDPHVLELAWLFEFLLESPWLARHRALGGDAERAIWERWIRRARAGLRAWQRTA